jgi:6-phosphogluconolactonase
MPENEANPEVIVCADADEVARRAADRIVEAARAAVEARGRFTLVLSGGSTPEKLYGLLAASPYAEQILWEQTYLFVGDERLVPHDGPASNYGMAKRTLLSRVPVPPGNVVYASTDLGTVGDAADSYEQAIRDFFEDHTGVPSFDLVLLGLGDDGHTASLFPGKPALSVTDRLVAGSEPGILPPPVDRITLTFPALNAARAVLFLVAGANKAPALKEVLSGTADVNTHPAAGVRPEGGTLTFLVDKAASGE